MSWINGHKSGWRRAIDYLSFALVLAGAIYVVRYLTPPTQLSAPQVVDGDSLRDAGGDIRLHGIDAPEYRQTCNRADGKQYDCGRQSARHLRKLIQHAGGAVECQVIDTDRYDRAIAVCAAGGRELNKAMVADGWAIAYTKHALTYLGDESAAKAARRGLWQGWFEDPALYRERTRAALATGNATGENNLPPD